MDFLSGLSRSKEGCDYIWVIVNRLTKSTHFLLIISTNKLCKLVKLFVEEIVRLHGVPVSIVPDKDPRFATNFWALVEKFQYQVTFHYNFYPQTDGHLERTIQIIENMLQACVLDLGGRSRDHLPLVEFGYNNSFHSSIGISLFKSSLQKEV